jgi:uncharacterized Fe-S center protein
MSAIKETQNHTGEKKYFLTLITRFLALLFVLSASALNGGCAAAEKQPEPAASPAVLPQPQAVGESAEVFMTKNISGPGLLAVYKKLNAGILPSDRVAIKIHMGERGNANYLSPNLLKDLCASLPSAALVDSNVLYGGARGNTAGHLAVAEEHGFTFAAVDILDADGQTALPIPALAPNGRAIVGSHILNYQWLISVAHFKGHAMAGFGGAFKNIAVGIASPEGKRAIHSSGPGGGTWSADGSQFLQHVIQYAQAIITAKNRKVLYINVLNNLSVDCDCDATAAHPSMPDIGILASADPVALEQASLDQIYARPAQERKHLTERIEKRNGAYQIEYARQLGLGSPRYRLVNID